MDHYHSTILGHDPGKIAKINICLGGDNGKGKFMFSAVIVVRFHDNLIKEAIDHVYQIGQIDDPEDSVELLQPLLLRLEEGIKDAMNVEEGWSVLTMSTKSPESRALSYG